MLLFQVSEGGNPSVQLSATLSSLRAIRGLLGPETILGYPWQNTVKSWKEMKKKNNRMYIVA